MTAGGSGRRPRRRLPPLPEAEPNAVVEHVDLFDLRDDLLDVVRDAVVLHDVAVAVEGYAAHERGVLESVVKARTAAVASTGSPESQARDENALVGTLKSLFAVAEGYPELKADRHFMHLQKALVETENRIQAARRFYNANVRDLNTITEMFPSNLIASLTGIRRAEYFQTDDVALPAATF